MGQDVVIRFQKALDVFVALHKKNPNVIGILLSGSFIHSKPDKNSDLDVSIVMREGKTRTRGNTWIDGVEIEYFMNPVRQIEEYFRTEVGDKAPCTAHMFANSVVLYHRGDEIYRLVRKAKIIMGRKAPRMSRFSVETDRYLIDDLEKDLEDTFLKGDAFAFNVVAMDVLKKSLSIFFRAKRVPAEKSKRLLEQIRQMDEAFADIYERAMLERSMKVRFKLLIRVIRHIEKMLGGKRPREWKLRGPCTA